METTILIIIYSIIVIMFGFDTWLKYLNYKNRNAVIPEEVNDIYDQKEYMKWLEYTMENHRLSMIDSIISFVLLIVMLVFGLFVVFNDWSVAIVDNYRLQILLFLGFYYLVGFIIGIFTSYYQTFNIEEKYGFNKMTKKTFITDKIKSFILTIVFGGGLVYALLVINEYAGDLFFLYAWLAIVSILLFINLFYTKLIVPIFNKLTPLEEGELNDRINEFAKSVGYEVTQIKVINASKRSSKLNAYFTGFGRFKKVVLYDTLIEKMSVDEIVAVLAHEIGHNKHKHIIFNLFQMVFQMLLIVLVLAFVLRVEEFSTAFGFDAVHFGFSIILFAVLLDPIMISLSLLTAKLSRKHEYQADKYATVNFSGTHMESALKVLAKENFANLTPHPLYVRLLYSHPPIVDRIKAIRKADNNE
jgi:STE24 endopeptidase